MKIRERFVRKKRRENGSWNKSWNDKRKIKSQTDKKERKGLW